ncbi:MAG: TonB-dependent receptor plug domain-containing protein [Bacteroidota bacterium]
MKTVKHIGVLFLCICLVLISQKNFAQARASAPPQGTYKTIYEMLKDVPGLEVKTNGSTGGGSIVVRGLGSLNNQGQPIFVVDGTVFNSALDIAAINTQDIESISVLKDAASQTAYGSRGMFGVIVITTKKGTGISNNASVTNHTESAYTYFIDHKTPLKIFDMNENVIIEGVIQKQKGDSLVFIKKRKDFLIAISSIKRVEMIPQN